MSKTLNRKPVFDAIRSILGRKFRSSDVAAIDRAIDCATGDRAACVPATSLTIGPQGVALIKQFEGCARLRTDGMVEAYPDPATGDAPWTIGWGATGPGIEPGTVWTQQECDERLARDLLRYSEDVSRALGSRAVTQAQFDALVSFHYNTGAIARATLTRKHREGDFAAAAREFQRWNKAGGKVLKGLTRRRLAEARLYSGTTATA